MDVQDYLLVENALKAAIPSIVGSDHRNALNSRLKYGNQISLRKRLAELADKLSQSIRTKLFGLSGTVPASWVDTRNYYTHWDEELRANVLDGQGMIEANLRMSLFLRALYLDLMGVPQTNIDAALIGMNNEAQWLMQINGRASRA